MDSLIAHSLTTMAGVLADILPIAAVIAFFQLFVLRRPVPQPRRVAVGVGFVIVGLVLFLFGLEEALFPLGRDMAIQLAATAQSVDATPGWRAYGLLYLFAAALGFGAAIAEPTLIAVAHRASTLSGGTVSSWGLRLAVALGVALGVALAALRMVADLPLVGLIAIGFLLVAIQSRFAPRALVPLAFDSGSLTVSTVTVPLLAAVGTGLAAALPGERNAVDGFGFIALACLVPVATVLAYAQFSHWLAARRR